MKIKKYFYFVMTIMLVSILFPTTSFAHVSEIGQADIIVETNNPEIGVAFFIKDEAKTRSYHTRSKTGTGYFYKKADGSRIAEFDCTGTFSYDGKICNVLSVSTNLGRTIEGYQIIKRENKNQISPTYARATGVFELYKLGLFGDKVMTSSAVINIYCNQSGNINVEFNSDND